MSRNSLEPSEHGEYNHAAEDPPSLGDAGRESMRGFPLCSPLADETRMGLYKLNKAGADRTEFTEWADTLSHEEHENLRLCTYLEGNTTYIYDTKGNERLEFFKSSKLKPTSDEQDV